MDKAYASGIGYTGRPMPAVRTHPELSNSDKPLEPTVSSLANNLSGQLNDATNKVAAMLGRLRGLSTDQDDSNCKVANQDSILTTLAVNCDRAGGLLNLLCELESRIGG